MRRRRKKNKYIKYIVDIIINDTLNGTNEYDHIRDYYFIVKALKNNYKVRVPADWRYKLKAFDVFYRTPLK